MIQLISTAGALAAPLALLLLAGPAGSTQAVGAYDVAAGSPGAWRAEHARFGMVATFESTRLVARSSEVGGWALGLDVAAWGRGEDLTPLAAQRPTARGRRVEWTDGDLTTWYVHDERGLEQGFTAARRPAGDEAEPLVVRMSLESSLTALACGASLAFVDADGRAVLQFAGLAAWDAAGRALESEFRVDGDQVEIAVDDRGAAYPVMIDPLLIVLQQQVFASDRQGGDAFGVDVALAGDILVVGADKEDAGGTDAGAAYVYARSGSTWTEQAKLTAFDNSANDRYGAAVAVSGETVAIGSLLDDDLGGASGSVYVYTRSGTVWSLEQKLFASDGAPGDTFGFDLVLQDDRLVVSSPQDDDAGNASGSVYVFDRTGTVWTETAKVTASDASIFDMFGESLDLSGTSMVVGASGVNRGLGADQGAVYVFVDAGTAWIEQQKITAADGAMGYFFGSAVAIDGDRIAVGSDGHALAGFSAGAVYLYERDMFGFWAQTDFFTPLTVGFGDMAGERVDLDGDFVVFSARGDDDTATDAGAVFVYQKEGPVWIEMLKILDSGGANSDDFGSAVALDELSIAIGANRDDEPGGDTGSAFVYTIEPLQALYCTGKTNSLGCVPFISVQGYPSVSSTINYRVIANDVVDGEAGFPVYGTARANLNFHGGKLCVKAPFRRLLPAKLAIAQGPPPCSGVMKRNFNNHIQFGGDPLLTAGHTVTIQWRQRDFNDPTGFGDNLTNALEFTICP